MIGWPHELVSDIARRRCIVFLGAGVSRNSQSKKGRRPKTWVQFLLDALKEIRPNGHIKSLVTNGDCLTACEIIKNSLGRERFNSLVIAEFLSPGYAPSPLHKAVFRLDSRIVATPNFDKIYETYANSEANGSIRVKHNYDADARKPSGVANVWSSKFMAPSTHRTR